MDARAQTRVIAHRGASGYLPEHTLAAKCLAYGMGADFLEQDVVATRDGELVVLHDIVLDDVTDVASRYPSRRRADGHFYVIDFELAELQRLQVHERRRPGMDELLFAGRYPDARPGFAIMRLEDELSLVRRLNASTGRRVGVYPEIKAPQFHAEQGIDLALAVIDAIERSGWTDAAAPIFVQSFDAPTLQRLRAELGIELPLVQLLDRREADGLVSAPEEAGRIAGYAAAVGIPYESLMSESGGATGAPLQPSRLSEILLAAGLALHPYTFRREAFTGNPEGFMTLLRFFIHELGVEALFCDQPDIAIAAREHGA